MLDEERRIAYGFGMVLFETKGDHKDRPTPLAEAHSLPFLLPPTPAPIMAGSAESLASFERLQT